MDKTNEDDEEEEEDEKDAWLREWGDLYMYSSTPEGTRRASCNVNMGVGGL